MIHLKSLSLTVGHFSQVHEMFFKSHCFPLEEISPAETLCSCPIRCEKLLCNHRGYLVLKDSGAITRELRDLVCYYSTYSDAIDYVTRIGNIATRGSSALVLANNEVNYMLFC
jgi:hypothetical protein